LLKGEQKKEKKRATFISIKREGGTYYGADKGGKPDPERGGKPSFCGLQSPIKRRGNVLSAHSTLRKEYLVDLQEKTHSGAVSAPRR